MYSKIYEVEDIGFEMLLINSFSLVVVLNVLDRDFLEARELMVTRELLEARELLVAKEVLVLMVFLRLFANSFGGAIPRTNLLILLMTLFFMIKIINIMKPLRALMMSRMKTTTCSEFPMAPVIESATQGSPIPKKSQTTIVNF